MMRIFPLFFSMLIVIQNMSAEENDERKLIQRSYSAFSISQLLLSSRMGSGSSTTTSTSAPAKDNDFQMMVQTVQTTWWSVKKIDNLGPKTFAQYAHI